MGCGLTLAGASYLLVHTNASPTLSASAGATIEAAFGAVIFMLDRREVRLDNSFKPDPLPESA